MQFPKEWTAEAQIEPVIVALQALLGATAVGSMQSTVRPQCTRWLGPVTGFCENLESF